MKTKPNFNVQMFIQYKLSGNNLFPVADLPLG